MTCPNGHGDWYLATTRIATCRVCSCQWEV
jgi:hypothetical protein